MPVRPVHNPVHRPNNPFPRDDTAIICNSGRVYVFQGCGQAEAVAEFLKMFPHGVGFTVQRLAGIWRWEEGNEQDG